MHQIEGFVIKKEVVKKPNKCVLSINHCGREYHFIVPPKNMSSLIEIDRGSMVKVEFEIHENQKLILNNLKNLSNNLEFITPQNNEK